MHPANQTMCILADIGAGKDRSMNYRVVLRSDRRDIETLYWSGSLEETRVMAREIALKCEADGFRILAFSNCKSEVCVERRPFEGARAVVEACTAEITAV